MDFVLIGLATAGIAAVIGLPVRMLRVKRWFPIFLRLGIVPKLISAFGLVLLVPATLLWLYFLYVIYKIFLDPGTPRVWGVSELGMTLTAFAIVYLIAELLLLPMTLSTRRSLTSGRTDGPTAP